MSTLPRVRSRHPKHSFLRYGASAAPWRLTGPGGHTFDIAALARLRVDDGDAVRDWALAGHGIMLKSEVDVAEDLGTGRLERVLPEWHGGEAPVVALYPNADHHPLKLRVFLDELTRYLAAVVVR